MNKKNSDTILRFKGSGMNEPKKMGEKENFEWVIQKEISCIYL